MSRRSIPSETEARLDVRLGTPPGSASSAASRIRLVVVEAEGDLKSIMPAIDALAEALNRPSKDGRSSECPTRDEP